MNYLIDTNTLIFLFTKKDRIPERAYELILEKKSQIFVSDVSFFEIAIKQAIKKFPNTHKPTEWVRKSKQNHIYNIPIEYRDYDTYTTLKPLHRNPYDRLIISQAINRDLTIITADKIFDSYPVSVYLI